MGSAIGRVAGLPAAGVTAWAPGITKNTYQQYGVMTSMAGTSPTIDVRLISLTSAPERRQAAPRLAVRGRQRR